MNKAKLSKTLLVTTAAVSTLGFSATTASITLAKTAQDSEATSTRTAESVAVQDSKSSSTQNSKSTTRSSKTSSSSAQSYSGATTISSSVSESGKTYTSTTDGESVILVSSGESTLQDFTLSKTGDADGDNADFYGTNAGILVYGGTLNIDNATLTTDGAHANAVFAYGNGTINISNSRISTSNSNSGGIMVTGGGTLNATSLTVETQGSSSAAIRSDRGGGTITVNGGSYTSNGSGSPAIYSTADITVNDAKLVSNLASGVVIEGNNSVTLNAVDLYNNNTQSNTKGEETNYKNIFIYQSTSGDASEGTGYFVAKNSKITTANGSTFFVTNTTADITLENNEILNTSADGLFLKAGAARWGQDGANGGTVALKLINQYVDGDIVLDEISTLNLDMSDGSVLVGAINNANTAKNASLTLSSDSILSLTADTYLTSLHNADSDNSNIYSNGQYKLYVNGEEVEINEATYEGQKPTITSNISENTDVTSSDATNEQDETQDQSNILAYIVGIIAIILVASGASVVFYLLKHKKN